MSPVGKRYNCFPVTLQQLLMWLSHRMANTSSLQVRISPPVFGMLRLVRRCTFSQAIATPLHVWLFLRMGSIWSLEVWIELLAFGMFPQVNSCGSSIILTLSVQLPIHRMENTLLLAVKISWLGFGRYPQDSWCVNSQ